MKQTSNEIMRNLERIQGKDTYTLLHDFFIMSAISIRNSVDHRPKQYEAHENRYKSIAKNYNADELKIISECFAMLYKEYQQILNGDKPFCDLLGELYMSSNTSNGKAGQFFTPYCLSQMWETPAFIFNFLHFNKHRKNSLEVLTQAKERIKEKHETEQQPTPQPIMEANGQFTLF